MIDQFNGSLVNRLLESFGHFLRWSMNILWVNSQAVSWRVLSTIVVFPLRLSVPGTLSFFLLLVGLRARLPGNREEKKKKLHRNIKTASKFEFEREIRR